jgi:hypothetical protein
VQAKCTSDNVNECTAPAVLDPDAKCNGDPCTVDDFGDDETDCCVGKNMQWASFSYYFLSRVGASTTLTRWYAVVCADKETLSKKCPCGLNECPDKCPWFAKVAGLPLPNCPSCSNQKLDGKEDGIDCGGNCDPCPTCKDNRKNGDEIEKDCGGSCDPCYTCTDGYKNGGEEDVDCGGEQVPGGGPACDPCPTCSDHIKNGDEDETDCGGPSCDPCYTCSDGLQNGDEEGVDCGGSCDPLCVTA